ncbi:MAG: hypothetical protein ACYCUM_04370 [Solirubrobacteraceae bacterium]
MRRSAVLACALALIGGASAGARPAFAAPRATAPAPRATAPAPRATAPAPHATAAAPAAAGARAPSGPPLVSGASAYATPAGGTAPATREPGEGGEVEREAAAGASEPLVENGLSSPLCTQPGADLSSHTLANCASSGFVASAAPTSNYGFDVNIGSGPRESVAATFQDFLIKPPWALLVWAVHSLLVGIEWAYTIDLLGSRAMSAVARALRALAQTLTHPLLAIALACSAVAIAWRGLVRREHAASIGEALAVLGAIGVGLVIVLDPLGTVGQLARVSDAASIDTLGTVAGASPASPDRTLAHSATQMFATAVLGPWCFMEFGNVAWCEEPRQLDPTLLAAARRLAHHDEAEAARSGAQRAAGLRQIARLLRSARTNGAIFLAQPANGPARNSSESHTSLLHAICGASSATRCRGATAAEAEFRTSGFTVDRLVGLVMILAGALGIVLLLGFVLARLLSAAVLSLLFLLLAPGALLLPAFGERGRGAFREWFVHLLGAVVAKLMWSFLLGTLIVAMSAILLLGGFGWWVQWLLMAVLWWGAFHHREQILAFRGERTAGGRRRAPLPRPRAYARRLRWRARDLSPWRRRHHEGAAHVEPVEPIEPVEPVRLPRAPRPPRSQRAPSPPPPPPPSPPVGAYGDPAAQEQARQRRAAIVQARQKRREEGEASLDRLVEETLAWRLANADELARIDAFDPTWSNPYARPSKRRSRSKRPRAAPDAAPPDAASSDAAPDAASPAAPDGAPDG